MSLSNIVRSESATKLREAAAKLEAGDEKEAGKILLAGLKPVARDLKRTYGPLVRALVNGWLRSIFDEE